MWTDFTNRFIKTFKHTYYKIDDNCNLLSLIKGERNNIKLFIKHNIIKLYFKVTKLSPNYMDNKISNYINSQWIDSENIKNQLHILDTNVLIEWKLNNLTSNTNKIYIKATTNDYNKFICRVKLIIIMIEYLKNKSNNQNKLTCCYLILSNLKKYLPENNQIIGIKNVNSGFSDSKENYIFIWRYEEYQKLIFHEMIHNLNMDHRYTIIQNLHNITNMHNYFEAITDFWGIFYHIIYLSLVTRVKIKNLLEIELGFIKNQAMLINNFFGLNNWIKLKHKNIIVNISTYKPTNIINQNASVFSYYIIKYLLFKFSLTNDITNYNNYNELFKLILENGFTQEKFISIKSSRMTLLQLK